VTDKKRLTKTMRVRLPDEIYRAISREAERLGLRLGTVAGLFLTLSVKNNSRLEIGVGEDPDDER